MSFFIQDLHLKFHSFLGFQHESGLSVKAILLLSATLVLAIGLNFFGLEYHYCYIESQSYLVYLSSILKISKQVFKNALSVHT